MVRDVIRLFMDHHTFKIAQTEANRAADPEYQKEPPRVADLKGTAPGAPTGSRKTKREWDRKEKRLDAGGGGDDRNRQPLRPGSCSR